MSERDNGGPAFPREYNMTGVPGMSLRDWFAGQALAGLLADGSYPHRTHSRVVAEDAYGFADAMLAVREEPPA